VKPQWIKMIAAGITGWLIGTGQLIPALHHLGTMLMRL
jgi:hypothetical protein